VSSSGTLTEGTGRDTRCSPGKVVTRAAVPVPNERSSVVRDVPHFCRRSHAIPARFALRQIDSCGWSALQAIADIGVLDVQLHVDERLAYGRVAQVMAALQRAGVARLSFVTFAGDSSPTPAGTT
jgi:hypothetical protein